MKLNKEFVGTMKDDAKELVDEVEKYFIAHQEMLLKKLMSEDFTADEANTILLTAKQETINMVLAKYLELYKSHQNKTIS